METMDARMNPRKHAIRSLIPLLLALLGAAHGAELPRRSGLVNDFAAVLSPSARSRAEAIARELLEKSGATVAVAVVPDMGGETVERYATDLYEAWGVGRRGEDRGALLLVAVQERKVRIEVGYGLEGILPDGKVGQILDRSVTPHLRDDDWDSGVVAGVAALARVIAEDAGVVLDSSVVPPPAAGRAQRAGSGVGGLVFLVILILLFSRGRLSPWLLLFLLGSGGRRGRGGSSGGGFGSFGGGGFSGFGGGMSGGGGASRGF